MTKIQEASLPGRSDGSSLHYTGWSKRNPAIYINGNTVAFSVSWEFKPGDILTPEQLESAQKRGYILVNMSESTTTPDVATLALSASKVKKRIPQDAFVLLFEIEADKLSEEQLARYIHLCDFYLTHYEEVLDSETQKLLEWFDAYGLPIDEVKLAKRTPLSKKLASAKRYRNRHQHILNKKKQAQANKVNKVIAKKMGYSLKTKSGREQKKYHVEMRSLNEYMKYVKLPPLPLEVPETRQEFKIDGKIYSTSSSIIKSIREGLEYAIKNNCEHYIEFENGLKVEVRQLIKSWR